MRFWLVALPIALICLLRAAIGLTGTQMFSHDAFVMLDGGWRMLHGQRAHADFFTGLGPVAYWPTAAGLLISGGRASGFGYGQALFGLVAGCWAYVLGRRRLDALPAAVFCIAVTLLATAPFGLGGLPLLVTPDTTYNRYGYALVFLLLLEAFSSARHELAGGVSTGLTIVLLAMLKVSFGLGAAILLVCCLPCRPQSRARLIGIACGAGVGAVAFLMYLRFDLTPMLRDWSVVAGSKHFDPRWYFMDSILMQAVSVALFALAAAGLCRTRRRALITGGLACTVSGLFLVFTNHEESGFPLACAFAFLALNAVLGERRDLAFRVVAGWGVVLAGGAMVSDAMGMASGAAHKAWMSRPAWSVKHPARLNSPVLGDFVPAGSDASYIDFVNDGLKLVRDTRKGEETVMSTDFSDFFSYALQIPPARGGATFLQEGSNFTDTHRPDPEWLFGTADLIASPKASSEAGQDRAMARVYGPYLSSHFHVAGESTMWRVLRKNETSAASAAARRLLLPDRRTFP